MGKRREASVRRSAVLEPDAAGIDIGAEEIYVAVPPTATSKPHASSPASPAICTP
jgi:hypothetical protein